MSVIKTYGEDGKQNGTLIPLWHVDKGPKIDQVYLTTVLPGCMKGPHLHLKRRGLFFCVRGEIIVVRRWYQHGSNEYEATTLTPGSPPAEVREGIPAAIYNFSTEEALVLNMPSPPWRENDIDEHEVKDWDWRP